VTAPLRTVPLRICVFGPDIPGGGWLDHLAATAPADATLALFGRLADATTSAARVERHHRGDEGDCAAILRAAADLYPGDDLVLLQGGVALPPFWCERLLRAVADADVLVASPLDNAGADRSPLAEDARCESDAATVDALCCGHGRRQLLDWPTFSPLLSAWSGARLRGVALAAFAQGAIPAAVAPLRGVLLDHLYVADPAQPLRGPDAPKPGTDAPPPSALGELREHVTAALAQDAAYSTMRGSNYAGVDAKPVVLHVLHGWGGGAERFVRDLAAADGERHHLVLTARGSFARRSYGEALELRDATLGGPPLRRLVLSNPIRSTALRHRAYAPVRLRRDARIRRRRDHGLVADRAQPRRAAHRPADRRRRPRLLPVMAAAAPRFRRCVAALRRRAADSRPARQGFRIRRA
jgi:hypothetical protein